MKCPGCSNETETRTRPLHVRRGDRVVAVIATEHVCARCTDPETGEAPFVFVDLATMQANADAARAAWREKYGEEIPPPSRPGRKTDAPRIRRVPVLLSDRELEELDRRRGDTPRGEYVRRALRLR